MPCLFDLQRREGQVQHYPEEHGNSQGSQLEVKGSDSGGQFPAHPEVSQERPMGMAIDWLTQDADSELAFSVEEGTDAQGGEVDG